MDALTSQSVAAQDGAKPEVFVSYSRRDLGFVEALVAALDRRAIDVIIDRRDWPLAAEFQKELLGHGGMQRVTRVACSQEAGEQGGSCCRPGHSVFRGQCEHPDHAGPARVHLPKP